MAKQRHLINAPIVEALIDIRAKLPKSFEVEKFKSLKDRLHETYPKVEERRLFSGGFEIQKGKTSQFSKDMGLHGFFFKTEDELYVAQFRVDGFTFSRLKPYTSWEEVLPIARRMWSLYVEIGSPEFITRIAVRYINQLKIPFQFEQFSEILEAPPTLPEGVPDKVSSFLTRQVVHDPVTGIAVNFIQALEGRTPDEQNIVVLLDIDAYKLQDFEPNDERVFQEFETLRTMKNRFFFNSITERIVRLFE